MRKLGGVWFTPMDCFNSLLLPLLVLAAVFMLIWVGILGLLSMTMFRPSRTRTNLPLFFHQE